jgi:uncharacterized protein
MGKASLRFYAELCDLVGQPSGRIEREFLGSPGVKDLIEACGVPHTEVDLVLVNGEPVDFSYRISNGDRISVYPVFEAFDVGDISEVRATPLRVTRFVLDVHLGKLARYLRLLGLDAVYLPERHDADLVEGSLAENRILLTRDRELLKHGRLTHGSFIRATDPVEQMVEVVRRFHLEGAISPFTRCPNCNGVLDQVDRAEVLDQIEEGTRRIFDEFWRCHDCGQIYWRGAHFGDLERLVELARSTGTEEDG